MSSGKVLTLHLQVHNPIKMLQNVPEYDISVLQCFAKILLNGTRIQLDN